ncbi:ATP-binding protein [Pseudomonas sp. RIT-To-2]|uniref:ATP-binding protein n=1 Tax=Pseudomonas sp. RIT-To-2 TaxID=3462541 RepID=UPI0024131145
MPTQTPPSRFRPRARIMKTLGEELISSDSVAIIELVKNAYDADAQDVLIRFIPPLDLDAGCIEVIDNGKGMSLETVLNSWMEPATPNKVSLHTSKKGRRVLGEKGIGRFASARLSEELELISRQANSESETVAIFDWSQFDDEDKFLDEVEITLDSKPAETISITNDTFSKVFRSEKLVDPSQAHGTILKMSRLKKKWGATHFEEVQQGLSRLVSPFLEMSDFRISIEAPAGFEHFSSEISPPDVINYPHYKVNGDVFEDGRYELDFEILATGKTHQLKGYFFLHPKGGWVMNPDLIDQEKLNELPRPVCGPLKVELRVWDRDELGNITQVLGGTIASVRKDLDNFAGINIYRDNFRVMPYGEQKNDWLRLDLRRVLKPTFRLSNNQIVGYISISANGNPGLKDQSNREGLREGQAYSDLHDIMITIISKMEELRYVSKKGDKTDKNTPNKAPNGSLFSLPNLSNIREHLSKQHPADAKAKELVDSIEVDMHSKMESIKAVVARYSGLATLGKLVDALLHEGRQPLATISTQANMSTSGLTKYIKTKDSSIIEKTLDRLQKIDKQSKVLAAIFKRIEPLGGRRSGRPPKLYIEKLIENSFEIFETQLSDAGINYRLPKSQTLVTLDQHEVQQIFVNLIDNSIYWLQLVDREKRNIEVTLERKPDGALEIEFSDSGPGIAAEDRDSIFDSYYSSRSGGAGLGLAIVGEIVSSYYNGSLELLEHGNLPGACFQIILRKRV